jgi:hypothetical protein
MWAGAVTLAEATDLVTGETWLKAEASFVATGKSGGGEPIAGTDCVLVKSGELGPAGISAGVITLQGGLVSGSGASADASAESTSLTPKTGADGTEYVADLPVEGHLQDGANLVATAQGEKVPPFDAAVLVPAPLSDVSAEARQMARGLGITVRWAPGTASQVVLRLTGPSAAEQKALYEPAGITSTAGADEEVELDTEAASLTGASAEGPATVLCPARDEAGVIAVPPAVLELFDEVPIEATLMRQNLGFAKLPECEVTVRAAREAYFTVAHPAAGP